MEPMQKEPPLFSNMSPVDWLLAVVFTTVVVFLAQTYFPPWGWLIGLVVALGLLYLAKRRRDRLQRPPEG
jgi:O-antigen/teichoic acid export membrane protein